MEKFQVGDIVDIIGLGKDYTGRVLSANDGFSHFVKIKGWPGYISSIARDEKGKPVTEEGSWVPIHNLKLNKEAKVLKILRQCQTSRCVSTGNVS